jgi:uncharacterized radical SAM superfamily Fe-S cluster-containing enzyme
MLSDRDRELAKKHGDGEFYAEYILFDEDELAAFLAERDSIRDSVTEKQLDKLKASIDFLTKLQEERDAQSQSVRDALEKAAQIAGIAHENYERLKEVHVRRTPKAFVHEHYNINMDIVGYSKVSEDKIRDLIKPKE